MTSVRLRRIGADVRLHRIHRADHEAIFFGPRGATPQQRYDAPDGTYKVLYMARTLATAFGETLVRTPHIPFVTSTAVQARVRSELVTIRPLKLYPLLDAGVSAHGLSFADLHGDAYAKTWAASAEIHASSPADGILYTSRFDNRRCIALFDRARDVIAETSVKGVPLAPALASELAAHFGKAYVEP